MGFPAGAAAPGFCPALPPAGAGLAASAPPFGPLFEVAIAVPIALTTSTAEIAITIFCPLPLPGKSGRVTPRAVTTSAQTARRMPTAWNAVNSWAASSGVTARNVPGCVDAGSPATLRHDVAERGTRDRGSDRDGRGRRRQ